MPAGKPIEVTLKVAGVHWWYRSRSHASELTAGYYNSDTRDGYNGIIEMCARHGVAMTLTCVEMCDAQHPPEALCGPEGLLRQVCHPQSSCITISQFTVHSLVPDDCTSSSNSM